MSQSIKSQIDAIAKKKMQDAEDIFRASVFRLGARIIPASPVDKGIFRNAWTTAINKIDYTQQAVEDKSGSDSIAQLSEVINSVELGQTVNFNNPMPYGFYLEYDFISDQAPNGFLRVNTAQWPTIVEDEARKRA